MSNNFVLGSIRVHPLSRSARAAHAATRAARTARAGALTLLMAALAAAPAAAQTISFGKSLLSGTGLTNPTALQFGPDSRLCVTQQNGTILAYTVTRSAPNTYVV